MALDPDRKVRLDRRLLEADAEGVLSAGARPGRVAQVPCRLTPKPAGAARCPACAGRGIVVAPEGELARADFCSCVKTCPGCFGRACREEDGVLRPCRTPPVASVVNLINAARIPARYAEATFDNFKAFPGRDLEAVRRLEGWRHRFGAGGGRGRGVKGLVVTGPVGCGKTFLLAALARELCERGVSVRFTDFFQLLFDLRAGFSEGKADSTQLAPLIDVDVLIIDELGKGRNRDYDKAVLDQLVSTRYAANKTVIASTNYRLEDLTTSARVHIPIEQTHDQEFESDQYGFLESRVGRRIFSRLREMTAFVKLDGDDYRRRDVF